MNDLGESCYPSIETLARETGLSRIAIIKHINSSISLGWIVRTVHGYSGQGWRRHQYSIGEPIEEPEGGKPSLPASDPKVVNLESEGGKPNGEKVVNFVYPNSSENSSGNSSIKAALPEWVPEAAWNGFVEMRKKLRNPLTDRAKELAIAKLYKLKVEGHDPEKVLDQSTMNGWKGLFELKGETRNGFPNKAEERTEHNKKVLGAFLERGDSEVARRLF
jgi:hypothetical protein